MVGDGLFALVLGWFTLRGIFKGLFRESLGFLALVLAVLVSLVGWQWGRVLLLSLMELPEPLVAPPSGGLMRTGKRDG